MNRRNFLKCVGGIYGASVIGLSLAPVEKLNWVQQIVAREFGVGSSYAVLNEREFRQARWRINKPIESVPTNPNCLTIQVKTHPNQDINSDVKVDWVRIVGPKEVPKIIAKQQQQQ